MLPFARLGFRSPGAGMSFYKGRWGGFNFEVLCPKLTASAGLGSRIQLGSSGSSWPVTDIPPLEISDSVGALMLLLPWLSPTRSGGAPSARRDGALLYPGPLCGGEVGTTGPQGSRQGCRLLFARAGCPVEKPGPASRTCRAWRRHGRRR